MKVGEPGYVYVLINPSMEGLVKVGKTTRNPQDRVEELSSSTGVPTPFILVYQEYFEDCSKAELMIHQILESKNARISKNREFFKAQPYEVIKIIQNLKYNHLNKEQLIFDDHVESEEIIGNSLAEDLFQQGLKHYFGKENFIQDYQEALLCFKKAAKIGHADSHRYLGIMYWLGHGCKKNLKTTLEYLKKGANLGEYHCYALMGIIFTVEPNLFHQDNSYKSWSNFFSYLGNSLNNLDILYILEYISLCLTFDIEIQFTDQLSRFKEQLLESIDLFNKRNCSEIDNETVLLRAGVNYFIRSPVIDFEKIERGYKVFHQTWGLGIYTGKEKLEINGVIKGFYVIVNHKGEKLYIAESNYSSTSPLYYFIPYNDSRFYPMLKEFIIKLF